MDFFDVWLLASPFIMMICFGAGWYWNDLSKPPAKK